MEGESLLSLSDCIVKRFGAVSTEQRRPTNHVAFFDVNSNDCKWICESYQPCSGIDIKQVLEKGNTNPSTGCFIHSVLAENLIAREEDGLAIYHFLPVVTQCQSTAGDDNFDVNWATNGAPTREYAKGRQSF